MADPQTSGPERERADLDRLARIVERAGRSGVRSLDARELALLPQLYRFGASVVARLETSGHDPAALERARRLVTRAHGILYRGLDRPREGPLRRALRFLLDESPRAIRAEWRVLAISFALFFGLALASYVAVSRDLELAYSLLSPDMVSSEIQQLEATADGEPFRGNFTFGIGRSPNTSGWIMAHNISVGVLFFGAGLVPPMFFYMIATNGLMVGTYTAVAGHWGQAGAISSILWCHGTLELQALVLAGAAGLVLVRAWIAPGPWSRRHAMRLERARAWRLFAPIFPLLVTAGTIEGFVSPHAPLAARLVTAVGTGSALVAWVLLGGRSGSAPADAA